MMNKYKILMNRVLNGTWPAAVALALAAAVTGCNKSSEPAGGGGTAGTTGSASPAAGDTIKVARLAKETGLFPVFEALGGEVSDVSKIRRRAPVEEYLKLQGRYRHLFAPERNQTMIARIQGIADRNIDRFGLL